MLIRDGGVEKSGSKSHSILYPAAAPFHSLLLYAVVTVLGIPVDRHPGQEKADLCSCLLIRSKAQCIMQLCVWPGSLEREWAVGPVWEIQRQGFIWGLCLVGVLGFFSQNMNWGSSGGIRNTEEALGESASPTGALHPLYLRFYLFFCWCSVKLEVKQTTETLLAVCGGHPHPVLFHRKLPRAVFWCTSRGAGGKH